MKLPAVLVLCATIVCSHGHDAPAPGASVPERFSIVVNGKEDVFRIDTATGKTWRLQAVAPDVRGWVPVVETVKDAKGGGYKPALPDDANSVSQPEKAR